MDFAALWKVYAELGVAAFFAALYLGTVWVFWKDIKEQRKTSAETLAKVITALDTVSAGSGNAVETLKQLKQSLEETTRQTGEFMAYLKGRDHREE